MKLSKMKQNDWERRMTATDTYGIYFYPKVL